MIHVKVRSREGSLVNVGGDPGRRKGLGDPAASARGRSPPPAVGGSIQDISKAGTEEGAMLKFFGSVIGIIFLIGLIVVIGLLALIF